MSNPLTVLWAMLRLNEMSGRALGTGAVNRGSPDDSPSSWWGSANQNPVPSVAAATLSSNVFSGLVIQ